MTVQGRIIKGIGGFYYVDTEYGLFECRAKGGFRKEGRTPLVGDSVILETDSFESRTGQMIEILPRINELVRPKAANVDQIDLTFSAAVPKPSYELLNRYLVTVVDYNIPVHLIVTKTDLASEAQISEIRSAFDHTPYPVFWTSSRTGEGIGEVKESLTGKLTVFAGPSGVGKSSLMNALLDREAMEVGTLSRKIERGKNTTRHAELFELGRSSYVLDTPGFSSVDYDSVPIENLALDFEEVVPFLTKCRYSTCSHRSEEGCAVREAVLQGGISSVRYESYLGMYEHLFSIRRYS